MDQPSSRLERIVVIWHLTYNLFNSKRREGVIDILVNHNFLWKKSRTDSCFKKYITLIAPVSRQQRYHVLSLVSRKQR